MKFSVFDVFAIVKL